MRRELKNAQAIVALLYDRIVTTVCGAAAAVYYPFSIGLLLQPNLKIIGRHATKPSMRYHHPCECGETPDNSWSKGMTSLVSAPNARATFLDAYLDDLVPSPWHGRAATTTLDVPRLSTRLSSTCGLHGKLVSVNQRGSQCAVGSHRRDHNCAALFTHKGSRTGRPHRRVGIRSHTIAHNMWRQCNATCRQEQAHAVQGRDPNRPGSPVGGGEPPRILRPESSGRRGARRASPLRRHRQRLDPSGEVGR